MGFKGVVKILTALHQRTNLHPCVVAKAVGGMPLSKCQVENKSAYEVATL